MKGWSPLTWVVLAVGLVALPVLWFTSDDPGAPARRAPANQSSAPLQPLPSPTTAADVPSTSNAASPVEAGSQAAADAPISAFAAIVERPLFLPDRHPLFVPPPPEQAPVVEPEPEVVIEPPPSVAPTPQFRLVGTLVDGRGNSLAIVESASTGTRTTLALGDAIDGWRLDSVGNGTIEVRLADQIVRLALGESP